MLFTKLLRLIFLITRTLAIPASEEHYAARHHIGARQGKPSVSAAYSPRTPRVEYSSDLTGVFINQQAGPWTSVTGTFTVPMPKQPPGGSSTTEYSTSIWVGIDGHSWGCPATLQTGITLHVLGTTVHYNAWYAWLPDKGGSFSGIEFSAGDTVTLTVTLATRTAGTATITNLSKDQSISTDFLTFYALTAQDAKWIVEDYHVLSRAAPFADFGTVAWTNAYATGDAGRIAYPWQGSIIYLKQDDEIRSSVSTHSSSITISYRNERE